MTTLEICGAVAVGAVKALPEPLEVKVPVLLFQVVEAVCADAGALLMAAKTESAMTENFARMNFDSLRNQTAAADAEGRFGCACFRKLAAGDSEKNELHFHGNETPPDGTIREDEKKPLQF